MTVIWTYFSCDNHITLVLNIVIDKNINTGQVPHLHASSQKSSATLLVSHGTFFLNNSQERIRYTHQLSVHEIHLHNQFILKYGFVLYFKVLKSINRVQYFSCAFPTICEYFTFSYFTFFPTSFPFLLISPSFNDSVILQNFALCSISHC